MDVVIMLSGEAARTLRERTLNAETEQIRELVAKSGGSLEPHLSYSSAKECL